MESPLVFVFFFLPLCLAPEAELIVGDCRTEQGKESLSVLPRIPGRGGPWDQDGPCHRGEEGTQESGLKMLSVNSRVYTQAGHAWS